jgi:hypothetical protein
LTFGYRGRGLLGLTDWHLAALYAASTSEPVTSSEVRVGTARFDWYSMRGAWCPAQVPIGFATVGACGALEFGALRGRGSTNAGDRSRTGVWLSPLAMLNATATLGSFSVRVATGAVRPLVRDSFRFSPSPLVFRAPALGMVGEFDVMWAFF